MNRAAKSEGGEKRRKREEEKRPFLR